MAGHCPGKCTCCFTIFISRAIVGAVSRSPWGGGAGAPLNGCQRGAASCSTRRAGCEARRCVSGSGGQGRGAGTRAGSHRVPRQRKPRHSLPFPEDAERSGRGIAGTRSHGEGLQDADANIHCTEPVLPPESRLRGWGSLGIAKGMGSGWRGEHRWGQAAMGTCQRLPSPSSFSITCAPFARAGGNRVLPAGTAWAALCHGGCQSRGCAAGGCAAGDCAACPGAAPRPARELPAAPALYEIICYFSCKTVSGPFPGGAREKPNEPHSR